jgi:hypothetical protein
MHAMLGLAATCLAANTPAEYGSLALSHRLMAIKGLNEALSKAVWTRDDGDALLAACYALTFLSSYLKDGIFEFLTMVRGCGLLSLQLWNDNVDVSFSIRPDEHHEFMKSRLNNLPDIDTDLLQDSASSFNTLLPLCEGLDAHLSFYKLLRDCAETITVDSREGEQELLNCTI